MNDISHAHQRVEQISVASPQKESETSGRGESIASEVASRGVFQKEAGNAKPGDWSSQLRSSSDGHAEALKLASEAILVSRALQSAAVGVEKISLGDKSSGEAQKSGWADQFTAQKVSNLQDTQVKREELKPEQLPDDEFRDFYSPTKSIPGMQGIRERKSEVVPDSVENHDSQEHADRAARSSRENADTWNVSCISVPFAGCAFCCKQCAFRDRVEQEMLNTLPRCDISDEWAHPALAAQECFAALASAGWAPEVDLAWCWFLHRHSNSMLASIDVDQIWRAEFETAFDQIKK